MGEPSWGPCWAGLGVSLLPGDHMSPQEALSSHEGKTEPQDEIETGGSN